MREEVESQVFTTSKRTGLHQVPGDRVPPHSLCFPAHAGSRTIPQHFRIPFLRGCPFSPSPATAPLESSNLGCSFPALLD